MKRFLSVCTASLFASVCTFGLAQEPAPAPDAPADAQPAAQAENAPAKPKQGDFKKNRPGKRPEFQGERHGHQGERHGHAGHHDGMRPGGPREGMGPDSKGCVNKDSCPFRDGKPQFDKDGDRPRPPRPEGCPYAKDGKRPERPNFGPQPPRPHFPRPPFVQENGDVIIDDAIAFMKKLDKNEDGTITKEEFRESFEEFRNAQKAADEEQPAPEEAQNIIPEPEVTPAPAE
ncbi:MAG: hypothetical protein Q4G68_04270 [Planctomycetia bacterium]|nr:hypothetical protein [Planctomycetia bacterium]